MTAGPTGPARRTTAERRVAEIESLDLEGRGVARAGGKVAFIDGALPGERVEWELARARPRFDTGRVVRVLRTASMRARPRCPHFGVAPGSCGGCSMQHLDARAQVAIKQRALEETLWHLGRVRPDLVLRPIAGAPWHYRHRARLTVRYVAKKGGVLVGFHERASSYVADMHECHVLPAPVAPLLMPLRELVGGLSIRDRVPQIEVAVGAGAGTPDTVLVFRVLLAPDEADRAALHAFAERHGVRVWLQPGGPETAEPLDPSQRARLLLALPEFGLELPFLPTDFTQVNPLINEVLVRRALTLLAPRAHERVADFFCGLGNFTLPLATRARFVTGLEGNARLLQRARETAQAAGLGERVRFEARNLFEWTVTDWDRLQEAGGGPVERVLLDPPREGALAVVRALGAASLRPLRLVYVSCNPATLARDCAVLVHESGWRLASAGIVNMFPHTSHVESIAVLEPPQAGT
ncbi:MAG TPA: 23S rRNA (uracil(1939)-C(5))-methyltransferase RlmD [Burkholderiaceae bacterium]